MPDEYLIAGRRSELERLQLQARVWEPAGRSLLARLGAGEGCRALDVGCGALGWLGLLSQWVGGSGEVVGSDIDAGLLRAARSFLEAERLGNVTVVEDDLFASRLVRHSFDLVHARFQLAPLGRTDEQIAAYAGRLRDGGLLVLEEPDSSSWHFNPPAVSAERLIALILDAFRAAGGDFDVGRRLPELLGRFDLHAELDAHVIALAPGHPYLELPLQFATSLEPRLLEQVSRDELAELRARAQLELRDPHRWGTTFMLIQAHARRGSPVSGDASRPRAA